jgi:hypothetical protein
MRRDVQIIKYGVCKRHSVRALSDGDRGTAIAAVGC